MSMRKWTIPLTLAGLGGLGAMLLSPRGRKLLSSATHDASPGRLAAWDDSAKRELDHIREALNNLEQSMGAHTAR